MSGSTIGGFVGGAIGFYFGGVTGAQWGFAIGSAIGGYVDPEKIQGPRLTDAQNQTAQDGIPITWGMGTYPTKGNLIWIQPGPPTEHQKTTRQGKGGPKATTFTYTRSYCIGICRGILRDDGLWDPITGILIVKRNAKIVYDARPDDVLLDLGMTASEIAGSRGASAAFLATVRFYYGSETQLPDPTIEAWEGVGNTPAHRGLANMVAIDHDVTRAEGAIDQFEFVITGDATAEPGSSGYAWIAKSDLSIVQSAGGIDWDATPYVSTASGDYLRFGNDVLLAAGGIDGQYSTDLGLTWTDAGIPAELRRTSFFAGKFWSTGGAAGQVNSTPDGHTWTTYATGLSHPLIGVGGSGSMICVGSNGGAVTVSTNGGGSWTTTVAAFPSFSSIFAVGCDGARLVIGGQSGLLSYSDDNGATWTPSTSPLTGHITGISVEGGIWIAASLNGIAVSANGAGWTICPETVGLSFDDVDHANGLFVATGRGSGAVDPIVFTSLSGSFWTESLNYLPNTTAAVSVVALVQDLGGVPIPDAPGYFVLPDGTVYGPASDTLRINGVVLAQWVAYLFRRAGLSSDQYDVSQLTDIVIGARIASDGGFDSFLAPQMQAFFFDVADWDGVVHCVKRGGASMLTLTMADIAQRDGDPIEWERIQEAELLRKTTVGYIDPRANFNITSQSYERRAGTVQAKGESSIGLPIVTDHVTAAQIAEKRTNVAWAETDKARLSLPVKFTRVTATDVVTVVDSDSIAHRIRMMQKEEEPGLLMFEAPKDRQSAYTGSVGGVAPNLPTPPPAALIGPTLLMAMNLPALTEGDDEVGIYVAGRGLLPEWDGASVDLSSDGGATWTDVAEITTPSTIGYTESALAAVDQNFPDQQSLNVWLPDAPSSVDYETLLRYSNRAAIQSDSGTWEVLQYMTVVANGDNSFTLSGIVRGRYNTPADAAASGANFVLLDSTVQFVRAERWMIGSTFDIRAVSYGTDPDAAGTESILFDPCWSQTEWPPHWLEAVRDVSDNITSSCIMRARLGVETAPVQSKYFAAIRFTYTDGLDSFSYDVAASSLLLSATASHTYDTAQQTADFGGPPSSLTVTVAAVNVITGATYSTEEVTV